MFKVYFALISLLFLMAVSANYYESRQDEIKRQFCGELYSNDNSLSRQDANELCIARLAYIVQGLRDQITILATPGQAAGRRYLFKRPTSKPIDDEIKRNSIDSLHGLTLG